MTAIRRICLLTKRLFKKPGFIVILVTCFLFSGALCSFCDDGGSVVRVAVALTDPDDPVLQRIAKRLTDAESIIKFTVTSPQEAKDAVESGDMDEAWILPEDIELAIEKYFLERTPIATVIRGRQDVTNLLSVERLNAAIYPEMSYRVYVDFIKSNFPDNLDEAQLRKSYDESFKLGKLIETQTVDSVAVSDGDDFLGASTRGIVALVVLFAALSAQMYYLDDREKGCFDGFNQGRSFGFNLITVMGAALICAVLCFCSLWVFGYFKEALLWEGISYIVYAVGCGGFCMLLGAVMKKTSLFGVLIPFIMILSLFVSPIFFEISLLRPIAMLLPCYWYLQMAANASMTGFALLYLVITLALSYLAGILSSKHLRV